MHAKARPSPTPLVLKDAPALIESVFPAQKISFEAQKERKANLGQTLTGLGSYWKGRKPLILVRAIVLGSLLPATDNAEADLEIFEKLLGLDDGGLARRALAANAFSPQELTELLRIGHPQQHFSSNGKSWKRGVTEEEKLTLYRQALATLSAYEAKAALCKRPEEVDQDWLYASVWPEVNHYYAKLGIAAQSFPELIEQLGLLRYGHRPYVADTFCGGGSIPFEAARLGCDVFASDLNPIACMLSWGALNVIGALPETREEMERTQQALANAVNDEVTRLGIEHDERGNRAKAYLYCVEARCPQTGWVVPLSTTWVISRTQRVIARLVSDSKEKRFTLKVAEGASEEEMKEAEHGTVEGSDLVYELEGKSYRTPIRTLRGDYRLPDGTTGNRLRPWEKSDFKPRADDIFQERLYAIQWVRREGSKNGRQETFFTGVSEADIERERRVEALVAGNLSTWQASGWIPDMQIEPGDETARLARERGWMYWHQLFTPRELVVLSIWKRHLSTAAGYISFATALNYSSKLCQWITSAARKDASGKQLGGPRDLPNHVFYNQALNTFFNYAHRSAEFLTRSVAERQIASHPLTSITSEVQTGPADAFHRACELIITDPPYADAVMYHEITEFFIAWLRRGTPTPFDTWVWDSRRALAIKGADEAFRSGMVASYKTITEHMPENGMQCVMFTHQDTGVWSDLVSIFWAAGLQAVAAWYIATETTSELKKGGYVQGTVILMLKKRSAGERVGFKQRILPAVRAEVQRQIEIMMHLNDSVRRSHGEPVFNDSDLQMAGYAAALKVFTAYTQIGGEDVTAFAVRPRVKGETTIVDEIVQQAAEAANALLVPDGLTQESWARLTGIERFVLRMLDIETTGSHKLDNYQNFAKAFRVQDYTRVMADMRPTHARLKRVTEFVSRDLTESTELGATRLGRVILALQQLLKDTEPQVIVSQLQVEMPDFFEVRGLLVDLITFLERKVADPEVRARAEVLAARLKNLRFGA